MWQKEKTDASIVRLVLWVALATTQTAATLVVSAPMLAQSTPKSSSFPLPQTVQNGTTVRIDGSSSLAAINQSLKENFEKQFLGAKIEVAANGTDTALKALLDGKIDIAAIGRGLTPAEKAQGLEQIRLRREKIAIVVGAGNPFKQSLTNRQFARIFRGKVTDWSQLGGPQGKIRVIDRPKTSDTRNTFRDYPAFKAADFTTGSNATQVTEDNTAEIVKQLGKDGISYVLANQVSKLKGVRVLPLHQTLPTDAKYPFSQPLVYVYKKNPSSSTVDFLGFTLAPPGQQAIEQGRTAEAEAIAASISKPVTKVSPTVEITPDATPSPSATNSVFSEQPFVAPGAQSSPIVNRETPFWLLLPLLITTLGGSLLWWFLGRRPSSTEKTDNLPESNPHPPSTEDREMAMFSTNSATLVNEATLEEQPVSHFQGQETSDNTPFHIYTSDQTENATAGTSNLGEETTNGSFNSSEGTTSGGANGSESSNLGAATLTSGAVLATGIGAATWSAFTSKGTEANAIQGTAPVNNHTDITPPESDQVAWDIEAPAAVVNTSYPHLANIPEEVSDGELPDSEVTDSLTELPDVPEVTADFDYWDTEVTEEPIEEELQAEFDWLESITSDEDTALVDELPLPQAGEVAANDVEPSATPTAPLLELPEEALNVVADAAEPTVDFLEEESPAEPTVGENVAEADSTGLAAAAALAASAGIAGWATTLQSNVPGETDSTVDNTDPEEQSSITLTPRTWESANVSWEISETQKAALRQQGGSQLVVRLYDVTGIDLSYQSPQFVQQYECEETATDRLIEIPVSDRDYIAEIGYIADGNHRLFIARSAIVHVFSPVGEDPVVENFLLADATDVDLVDIQEESSVMLTPRTPEWADVSWNISETHKAALQQQGSSQLILRLYDVTGIDLSYQSPQLVQQYECEETARDRFVAIPVSDRDYIAEVGYIADGDDYGGKLRWLCIARSAIVRVFNYVELDAAVESVELTGETAIDLVDVEEESSEEESSITLTPRTPKWAHVSWHVANAQKSTLRQQGNSQLVVRLYDVTEIDLSYQNPQLVQQYECEEVAHDRFVAIPVSDRDYMVEIGYIADGDAYDGKLQWLLIARSAYVRVFSRSQGDFWFVADAELIIHGATQPNTSVTIDGHPIKIKPDGTFHLRLPFSDGLMDYLITVAADGESTRTIHKKFSQETSEN